MIGELRERRGRREVDDARRDDLDRDMHRLDRLGHFIGRVRRRARRQVDAKAVGDLGFDDADREGRSRQGRAGLVDQRRRDRCCGRQAVARVRAALPHRGMRVGPQRGIDAGLHLVRDLRRFDRAQHALGHDLLAASARSDQALDELIHRPRGLGRCRRDLDGWRFDGWCRRVLARHLAHTCATRSTIAVCGAAAAPDSPVYTQP
jgi:hypothetical protein